ncbi:MAG: diguanylate cyclase [Chloroflexi bacterium]|nr:diguanylate cyclase [Chloroflexota bacterium]
MSTAARIYLAAVYGFAVGGAALAVVLSPRGASTEELAAFGLLLVLAAAAQLFMVDAPNRHSYHATPAFLIAAALVLDPLLLSPLVVLALVPEWLKYRYPWYIQVFNICTYLVNVLAAWAVFHVVTPGGSVDSSWRVAGAAVSGSVAFVALNHIMVALVLRLARGIGLRESGVFSWDSLQTDLALLGVGVAFATFWSLSPPLVALGIMPLFLFYRALFVPRLQDEAHHDAKTELLTARRFTDLLNAEVERATKLSRPTSVLMADLDLLRNVNNALGHLAGDEVLRAVADVIKQSLRANDPAGRFGGEEFVVLLRNTDAQGALRVAERLRAAVESTAMPVSAAPEPVRVTMSIGVASFPDPCPDAHKLVHYADLAVYRSKVNGRNRVSMAAPALDEASSSSGRSYRDILESLAFALDARGAAVHGQTVRVTALSLAIARDLGIEEGSQEWEDLERGTLLHDVGKLVIPSDVLYKPGVLDEKEWTEVRRHPEIGWAMLREIDILSGAAEIVRAHHEHWDGSGYPRGLKEEEIPPGARVLAAADAFDAITSERPYRQAQSEAVAVEEILRHRGTQFDPAVVDSLVRVLGHRPQEQAADREAPSLP